MKINIKIATTNPNFIDTDNNRLMFMNSKGESKEIVKQKWTDTIFSKEYVKGNFNELSDLTASVNFPYKEYNFNIERAKMVNYVLINIDGVSKYYFVKSFNVMNNDIIKYEIKLDVFTTYFDKLKFNGNTKVIRTHDNRIVLDSINGIYHNFKVDSSIWNTDDIKYNNNILTRTEPINVDDFLSENYKRHFAVNREFLHKPLNPEGFNMYQYGGISINKNNYGTNKYDNLDGSIFEPTIFYPIATLNKQGSFTVDGIKYGDGNNNLQIDAISDPALKCIISTPLPHFDTKKIIENKIQLNNKSKTSVFEVVASKGKPYNIKFKRKMIATDLGEASSKKIDDKANMVYESKLLSSQFKKVFLKGFNGDKIKLINEYLLSSLKSEFIWQYYSVLSLTQTSIITEIKGGLYDKLYNSSNSMFMINSYNQHPSLSVPYNEFIRNHLTSYNTGLAAAKYQVASSLVGTAGAVAGGLISGNPLAFGAAVGIANNVMGGIFKEKSIKAQLTDLKREASNIKGSSSTIYRDIAFMSNRLSRGITQKYGNTGILYEVYELPTKQKIEIYNFYNKYGYVNMALKYFTDYSQFMSRYRFTYWETANISNTIDKGEMSSVILEELNRLFRQGVMLWSLVDKNNINDFTYENWELDIVKNIKKEISDENTKRK